ncbi:MAG: tRNA (adenosine(37)-N6)-threonylcarbamoyltransferase complex transferase subunit TsaD [Caldiserica bacterium]|jgi:N6-L-threonylcarbamoyladenine synthase|nr:tRNA (adenosine(37)-N6)-threonylcarbamoyltransferase complex transferase subunit TsaD [Caldisericota bacterium]
MIFLGIETSCDETAVALLKDEREQLVSLVSSQVDLHQKYGGVVPELASRRHIEVLTPLIQEALIQAGLNLKEVDAVAVTRGPGLVGALLVGMETAKALSIGLGIPLLGVNHLAGHIYAAFLENEVKLPALALVVSGGHTELIAVDEEEKFRQLGTTRDDAAGETLDKIARFLGLPYPGGPQIDLLARRGDQNYHRFPVAEMDNPLDFSFSGLKTAVIYFVEELKRRGESVPIENICASFQEAVVNSLISKTKRAIKQGSYKRVIVSGGVAANSRLREKLKELALKLNVELYIPSPGLCTDNALMIARAGFALFKKGLTLSLKEDVDPNLSLYE